MLSIPKNDDGIFKIKLKFESKKLISLRLMS
jgi:hypothetical protein